MKRAIKIIIPIFIIGGIIAAFFLNRSSNDIVMNDGYVNGNTAGNLYNGGLFCENNGIIYFSNPSDGGKLYSMDSNGENLKKLADDIPTYINADENYVYYIRNNPRGSLDFNYVAFYQNALVRIDHDGDNILILDQEPCMYASLIGNYIYYLHYSTEDASTM